ncbi:MAG: AAA family ATPase [Flavobacteriales bacterium 32-34-25]|nr:MAG: AAA family ATPase [Flavobacteriales bacterium 32-34-25]
MDIILPKKAGLNELITLENAKSIVVIGANGSGKTRFGTQIELKYPNKTHRISAQKSLTMPEQVSPTSKEKSETDFFYGDAKHGKANKTGYRWGGKPNTFLLNDYQKLMVLLHTEEYEESIKFKEAYNPGQSIEKPITKLDRIQNIWEYVLPHRKLVKKAGIIDAYPTGDITKIYNASEMSDGERIVFYLIGEILSAPENSIIIIDEPEMHIHKSITKKLWDAIEQERPDSLIIYLTHDVDFASTRHDATKIWLKSFESNQIWDYEILDENNPIPEQVLLEILGSRKPILFIEGDNSSIDYYLFQHVFTEFTIEPLGNCNKVFETTKAFNDQNTFHHLSAKGIIDRDRRTTSDIDKIRKHNIFVPEVAEAENLLLIEKVVKVVAKRMFKNPDDVFEQLKKSVIELFKSELKFQAIQHTIFSIKKIIERDLNPKVNEFKQLDEAMTDFIKGLDYYKIYNEIENEFIGFVKNNDYLSILKVFNNKGIIHTSGLSQLCGLANKNKEYMNFVIALMKEKSNDSEEIISNMRKMIEV